MREVTTLDDLILMLKRPVNRRMLASKGNDALSAGSPDRVSKNYSKQTFRYSDPDSSSDRRLLDGASTLFAVVWIGRGNL